MVTMPALAPDKSPQTLGRKQGEEMGKDISRFKETQWDVNSDFSLLLCRKDHRSHLGVGCPDPAASLPSIHLQGTTSLLPALSSQVVGGPESPRLPRSSSSALPEFLCPALPGLSGE